MEFDILLASNERNPVPDTHFPLYVYTRRFSAPQATRIDVIRFRFPKE